MERRAKPVLAGGLAALRLVVPAAAASFDRPHGFHDDAGGANQDGAAVHRQAGSLEALLLTVTVVSPGRAVHAVLPGHNFEKARRT